MLRTVTDTLEKLNLIRYKADIVVDVGSKLKKLV